MRSNLLILSVFALLTACPPRDGDTLTSAEAQSALEESSISSQAETLISDGVELNTHFTIGKAVEQAAQELRDFIATELPCAEITLSDRTLTIEYGKLAGDCSWHGQTFGGTHAVTVMRNADHDVLVHHAWTDFHNDKVSVSGTADVTWSAAQGSRRVVHSLTWTVKAGQYAGRTGTGSGDRTQTALAAGLSEGIVIDGMRAWDGKQGHFELDIDQVEVRWADPLPQAGSYVLTTPNDKTLTFDFTRQDADTIEVEISSGAHSFSFDVNALGDVSRSGDAQPGQRITGR